MIFIPDPRERPVTGQLQIGTVAGFASERWPASNRNPRPASSECLRVQMDPGATSACVL